MDMNDHFVLHLADSADWVADHKRNLCYVCTRPFGTFRRKHHCRMCGEVVCKNCTFYKETMIEPTRVRVCMSCVMNNSNQRSSQPQDTTSRQKLEVYRLWRQNHLQSPVSGSLPGLDYDEQQRCSFSPKSQQDVNLFSAEGECRNTCRQTVEMEQQNNEASSEWTHPWPQPPKSADEDDRLQVLHSLNVLDTELEKPFDMICDLAKTRLSCPMAAVSFLDEHCQWFKASAGLAHKMIPRKIAFCAYTVYTREPMVILDTLQDSRFRNNPLVSGAAGVRFYAAAPIISPNSDHAVGSIFVLDTRPRESCDVSILERLALAAGEKLACRATPNVDNQVQLDNNTDEEYTRYLKNEQNNVNVDMNAQNKRGSFERERIRPSMDPSAASEEMEELLLHLLSQSSETQERLAVQQTSLSTKLGQHADQISKLMSDFARIEAKVESMVNGRTK
ncbi:unnamed protein product [Peronospora belbahrii]|uniref:FYVE-type domain-containing protein n=1 Tax=Peronospora belbahrii TaxID=622444 RepID=A0AAU9KW21_9STRA|nr:unnamed protein product [Peronospora belbahrii]